MTRTLLVVDDDSNVRQLVRRVVQKDFDATLLEASNGLVAIDVLMESQVDLLLLDISMPIMSGLETLHTLRRMPQYAKLPVVILAARAEETQVQELLGMGISGFLVKPFRPSLLRDRLGMVLTRVPPRPALPPRPRVGGLELDHSSRVLLLDENAEFRSLFASHLSELCEVEATGSAREALDRCASTPLDAVFVGALHTGVEAELFARKARLATQSRGTALIGLVGAGELESLQAFGLYEFTILRSFQPEVLRAQLRGVMSTATLARWFLAPTAAGPLTFAQGALEHMTRVLAQEVTPSQGIPACASVPGRWVEAQVEVQAHGLSWRLAVELPYASALRVGEAELGLPSDQLADAQLMKAAERLLNELGGRLADTLAADVCVQLVMPTAAIHAHTAAPVTPDQRGMCCWFTWNAGSEAAALTLAPLVPATAH